MSFDTDFDHLSQTLASSAAARGAAEEPLKSLLGSEATAAAAMTPPRHQSRHSMAERYSQGTQSAPTSGRFAPLPHGTRNSMSAVRGAELGSGAGAGGGGGDDSSRRWQLTGPTKTGTCLALHYRSTSAESNNGNNHSNSNCKNGSGGHAEDVSPLLLSWKGEEPLDKLHICLKVCRRCS